MPKKKLEKAILRTVLFFNLHRRPLSVKEIHRYLWQTKASEGEVFLAVMNLARKGILKERNRLFALAPYERVLKELPQRQKIKAKLLKKAQKFAWLIKLCPFVRGAFLANSLALGLPSEKSDIDLVVLVKPGFLWTARFFLNLLFALVGQKRRKGKRKDPQKFCLSYFVDLSRPNLKFLKLPEDPLLIWWLATLRPFLGKKACQLFLEANNWLKKYLPNWQPPLSSEKIKPLSFGAFLLELCPLLRSHYFRAFLFKLQLRSIKAKNKKDAPFASPFLYKMHPEGGRARVAQRFRQELKKLSATFSV